MNPVLAITVVCKRCETPLVRAKGKLYCGRCYEFRGGAPAIVIP